MVDIWRAIELAEELARPFEGLHRVGRDGLVYAYHDPVGYPTQGYGRLLSREVNGDLSKYPPITKAEAAEWLHDDLIKHAAKVWRMTGNKSLSPEQLAAVIDFAFNCGAGNYQMSTLKKMLERGDHVDAADQFMRWVYARGVKLPGLVRRRQAERALYLSGTK